MVNISYSDSLSENSYAMKSFCETPSLCQLNKKDCVTFWTSFILETEFRRIIEIEG